MKRRIGEAPQVAANRQNDEAFQGRGSASFYFHVWSTLRWTYHRIGHWSVFALAAYLFYQAGEISLIQIGIVGCGLIMRHTALTQTNFAMVKVLLAEQMIQAADPERAQDETELTFIP